ncbi:transposase [Spirillospora sp. NPDC048819]
MTTEASMEAAVAESDNPTTETAGVDQELVGRLVAQAREQGLELTGEGGLLQQLTKRVLESALEGEITDHLGRDRHARTGDGGGNVRNGHRSKTVTTEPGRGRFGWSVVRTWLWAFRVVAVVSNLGVGFSGGRWCRTRSRVPQAVRDVQGGALGRGRLGLLPQ